jgi:hypothetical protein
MKAWTRISISMGLGLFALSITPVFAFDGPNTFKAVMAYYDETVDVSRVC